MSGWTKEFGWTKELPTEPGWYWIGDPGGRAEIIHVTRDRGGGLDAETLTHEGAVYAWEGKYWKCAELPQVPHD